MSLKCQYIKQHVGSVFTGIISGVTSFGLFVELTDYFVDGLVHVASMNQDYYIFDPIHHNLTGERTGAKYSLGMEVQVLVAKVNTDEQKIDFNLVTKLRGRKQKERINRNSSRKNSSKNSSKKSSSKKRRDKR